MYFVWYCHLNIIAGYIISNLLSVRYEDNKYIKATHLGLSLGRRPILVKFLEKFLEIIHFHLV